MEFVVFLAIAVLAVALAWRAIRRGVDPTPNMRSERTRAPEERVKAQDLPARTGARRSDYEVRGVAFELWGGTGWPNYEVVGERFRPEAFATMYAVRGETPGVAFEAEAALVPEFDNPHDRYAVSVHIDGEVVGYIKREDAPAYHRQLTRLLQEGKLGVVPARVWATNDGGTWRARVSIALAPPDDILPLNDPPGGDVVEMPMGKTIQVTGEEDFIAHLSRYLGRERPAHVYACLRPGLGKQAKPKPCVDVTIDGLQVGRLSPQMSGEYMELVSRITQAGQAVVVRAKVAGNSLQPAVTLSISRVSELSEQWIAEKVPRGTVDEAARPLTLERHDELSEAPDQPAPDE